MPSFPAPTRLWWSAIPAVRAGSRTPPWLPEFPPFMAGCVPDRAAIAALAGKRVLAFAGIADPDKFFRTLVGAGIEAPLRRGFPDHHRYTPAEASRLLAEADLRGLTPVTTEKDVVRLDGDGAARRVEGTRRKSSGRPRARRPARFR